MKNTYDEALDIIYSYVDYSMTHAKDVRENSFSLENISELLKLRGNPQQSYPVIHVAGTKGKGSVCAMLAAALQNSGFKTGLYTSPHLIRFNERIMVDGKMISDDDVVRLTEDINETVKAIKGISSFEFMTAMAFEYFKEQNIDIAIVETGLGGRLDATNVVNPLLSVITSISYDHTNFLGNTIEKIAAEKAGIIKPGIPVICAFQPFTGAKSIIEAAAKKQKSPWINVPDRYHFINTHNEAGNESMMIWRVESQKLMEKWCSGVTSDGWQPETIDLPLNGMHQMQNAAVVYAVINKLKSRYNNLDVHKAAEGISNAFWPCRFEKLCEKPILYADGAHNSDSIEKLNSLIDRYCGNKTIKCIFGASEDKNLRSMIMKLAPHIDEFIMTRSIHPRAADPVLLGKLASETGRKNRITDSLEEAFEIFESETDENTCYIAAGSLFVAGGIREICMKKDPEIRYYTYNR